MLRTPFEWSTTNMNKCYGRCKTKAPGAAGCGARGAFVARNLALAGASVLVGLVLFNGDNDARGCNADVCQKDLAGGEVGITQGQGLG